jgi:hypothetical protein
MSSFPPWIWSVKYLRAKVQVKREVAAVAVAEYKPGVCNIGPHGRVERLAFGIAIIVFSLGLWHLARLNTLPSSWILPLFLPLFAGFVAVLEAALGFCVVFAHRGVYDLR